MFFPKHASSIQGSDFSMIEYSILRSMLHSVARRPPAEQKSCFLKKHLQNPLVKLMLLMQTSSQTMTCSMKWPPLSTKIDDFESRTCFFPKHASSIEGSDFDMIEYPILRARCHRLPRRPPAEKNHSFCNTTFYNPS